MCTCVRVCKRSLVWRAIYETHSKLWWPNKITWADWNKLTHCFHHDKYENQDQIFQTFCISCPQEYTQNLFESYMACHALMHKPPQFAFVTSPFNPHTFHNPVNGDILHMHWEALSNTITPFTFLYDGWSHPMLSGTAEAWCISQLYREFCCLFCIVLFCNLFHFCHAYISALTYFVWLIYFVLCCGFSAFLYVYLSVLCVHVHVCVSASLNSCTC